MNDVLEPACAFADGVVAGVEEFPGAVLGVQDALDFLLVRKVANHVLEALGNVSTRELVAPASMHGKDLLHAVRVAVEAPSALAHDVVGDATAGDLSVPAHGPFCISGICLKIKFWVSDF